MTFGRSLDGHAEVGNWRLSAQLPGHETTGPAVFEERESSCWFGPECRIRVDSDLTLLVDVER